MLFPKKLNLALALTWALSPHTPAHAADPGNWDEDATRRGATVTRLNEEGSAFYAAHDYRRAVERFLQAYATDPDPNLLFNIARCYHALGDNAAALEKYEQFVASPSADPEGRAKAQQAIESLKQAQQTQPAREPLAAPASPSASAQPPPASVYDQGVESSSSSGFGAWPWVTLAAGGVSAIVGGVIYAQGVSDHNQVTGASGFGDPDAVVGMTRSEAQALVDSGNSKKTIGGITLGVGGALLATSVILFVTDGSSDTTASGDLAIDAAPTTGGASVSLTGRF